MVVRRMAQQTSSTLSSGTSTSEKRSAISIAPTSLPVRFASPVIAPTRSLGRMPLARADADEDAGHAR